uniref:CENP-T/Histone H4 histone fold domain-containing protein n=1 Tax=Knipowitschia caucasica TaxID=637954 RepID=A0AAV2LAP7_KNICA
MKHIMNEEPPRTPLTRSVAAQGSGQRRSTRQSTNAPAAHTPQGLLRRSLKHKMRESLTRTTLTKQRRTTSTVFEQTPGPSSVLLDDRETPRQIFKNILLTEPVKSPLINEPVDSQKQHPQKASPDSSRQSRPSIELSGLELSDLTTGNIETSIKRLTRKRPHRSLNVTAFENRLKGENDEEEETMDQSSLSSLSQTSLTLKTPFIDVRTEKKALQRKISNLRKVSEDDFGAAVARRELGIHDGSISAPGQLFGETTGSESFGLSKISEPDITTDIFNCNTALYGQAEGLPNFSTLATQEKATVMASQIQRALREQLEVDQEPYSFPTEEKSRIEVRQSPEMSDNVDDYEDIPGPSSEADFPPVDDAAAAVSTETAKEDVSAENVEDQSHGVRGETEEEGTAEEEEEAEGMTQGETEEEEEAEGLTQGETEEEEEAEGLTQGETEEEEGAEGLTQGETEEEEEAEGLTQGETEEEEEAEGLTQGETEEEEEAEGLTQGETEEEEGAEGMTQGETEEEEEGGTAEEEDQAEVDMEGNEEADYQAADVMEDEEEEEAEDKDEDEDQAADVINFFEDVAEVVVMDSDEEAGDSEQAEGDVESDEEEADAVDADSQEDEDSEQVAQRAVSAEVDLIAPLHRPAADLPDAELEYEETEQSSLGSVNDKENAIQESGPPDGDQSEEEEEEDDFPSETPAFVKQKRIFLHSEAQVTPLASKNIQPSRDDPKPKSKPRAQRKPRSSKSDPGLPKSYVMNVFKHFAKTKVSADVYPVLKETTDKFFDRAAKDLEAYALHAKRSTIDVADCELLLRRQGHVNDKIFSRAIRRHARMWLVLMQVDAEENH